MTGFGRSESITSHFRAEIEVASVNRKQAEVSVSLPRGLSELEAEIRKNVLSRISRGRVNVSVKLTNLDQSASSIQIDEFKALSLKVAFEELSEKLGQELTLSAQDFLRMPEQFLIDKGYESKHVRLAVLPALESALDALIQMRQLEGNDLKIDFENRVTKLKELSSKIETIAPTVPMRQRGLLLKRLKDAALDLDPSDERVLKEIALFCDRCDISEEVTRLHSHFQKFNTLLASSEPVGRPLDFLCQELNREFNTIGSKANNSEIAHYIVTAKTELEKIREQIQNVE